VVTIANAPLCDIPVKTGAPTPSTRNASCAAAHGGVAAETGGGRSTSHAPMPTIGSRAIVIWRNAEKLTLPERTIAARGNVVR